jgi:hypothetical protein
VLLRRNLINKDKLKAKYQINGNTLLTTINGNTDQWTKVIDGTQDITGNENIEKRLAEIDRIDDEPSGSTKLHIACSSGNINEVRNLLKLGADVNVINKWGATPLDLAYSNGGGQYKQIYDEIARMLISNGGKTNN